MKNKATIQTSPTAEPSNEETSVDIVSLCWELNTRKCIEALTEYSRGAGHSAFVDAKITVKIIESQITELKRGIVRSTLSAFGDPNTFCTALATHPYVTYTGCWPIIPENASDDFELPSVPKIELAISTDEAMRNHLAYTLKLCNLSDVQIPQEEDVKTQQAFRGAVDAYLAEAAKLAMRLKSGAARQFGEAMRLLEPIVPAATPLKAPKKKSATDKTAFSPLPRMENTRKAFDIATAAQAELWIDARLNSLNRKNKSR